MAPAPPIQSFGFAAIIPSIHRITHPDSPSEGGLFVPFRSFPLVLLEWLDHTDEGGAWQEPSDELGITHCFTVGWVVGEDDTVVKVVTSLAVDEEGEDVVYSGPLKIVKSCIVKKIPITFSHRRK